MTLFPYLNFTSPSQLHLPITNSPPHHDFASLITTLPLYHDFSVLLPLPNTMISSPPYNCHVVQLLCLFLHVGLSLYFGTFTPIWLPLLITILIFWVLSTLACTHCAQQPKKLPAVYSLSFPYLPSPHSTRFFWFHYL